LETARQTLNANPQLTLVLVKGTSVYQFQQSGVRDLLSAIQTHDLKGFAAADKLVGKASALLMIQARISAVFAQTISQPAREILQLANIELVFDKIIEQVLNRERNGPCPMELLLWGIDEPDLAFRKLKEKIEPVNRS
jgi:hypothetical protein